MISTLAAHAAVLDMLPRRYGLFEFHVVVGFVTVGVLFWCTGSRYHCRLWEQFDRKVLDITHWMTWKEHEFSDYKINVICMFYKKNRLGYFFRISFLEDFSLFMGLLQCLWTEAVSC